MNPYDAKPVTSTSGSWALKILKILVSAGLLAFLLSNIDTVTLLSTISRLSPWIFILSGILVLAQLPVMAKRWTLVLRAWQCHLPFKSALYFCYIGYFFNQALPASIGGDVVRAWTVHKHGVAMRHAINSVLIERLTGLYSLVLLMAATCPSMWPHLPDDHLKRILVLIFIGATLGMVALTFLDLIFRGPVAQNRLIASGLSAARDLRHVAKDKSLLLQLLLLGMLSSALGLISIHVVAIGLDLNISLWTTISLSSIAVLSTVVPISIAGWGVRETAMVFLFRQVGVDLESALTLSFVYGLMMLITALPAGIIWVLPTRRQSQ